MNKALAGLQRGLSNLLARAVVRGLDTAAKCQTVDLALIANESKTAVEYLEPYGFTSAALDGSEAVVLFPDGDRSHGIVIAVADRRYRLKGLKGGEVALYTDEGDSIVMKRGRKVEVNTLQYVVNAQEKVTFNTPLVEVPAGNISDTTSTMAAMRQQFNDHDHRGDSGGTTGKPNQKMG